MRHILVAPISNSKWFACASPQAWARARSGSLHLEDYVEIDVASIAGPHAKRVKQCMHLPQLVQDKPGETAGLITLGWHFASLHAEREARGGEGGVISNMFEQSPWKWFSSSIDKNIDVWVLWCVKRSTEALPDSNNWNYFLSASTLKPVLERKTFAVPPALRAQPLAPMTQDAVYHGGWSAYSDVPRGVPHSKLAKGTSK